MGSYELCYALLWSSIIPITILKIYMEYNDDKKHNGQEQKDADTKVMDEKAEKEKKQKEKDADSIGKF